jgi:hypothetical protein
MKDLGGTQKKDEKKAEAKTSATERFSSSYRW